MNRNTLSQLLKAPFALLLAVFMLISLFGCSADTLFRSADATYIDTASDSVYAEADIPAITDSIDPDGYYYSKEDVSLYLYIYGELPGNFITKDEAAELGWEGGSAERYITGAAIGGDRFGNREGLLPKKDGRVYYECDIDTNGAPSRGAKRIVFSNDGLIYYTPDHYESFILLYGEE